MFREHCLFEPHHSQIQHITKNDSMPYACEDVWTHPHKGGSFFAVWQCFENYWTLEEKYLSLGSRLGSQCTICVLLFCCCRFTSKSQCFENYWVCLLELTMGLQRNYQHLNTCFEQSFIFRFFWWILQTFWWLLTLLLSLGSRLNDWHLALYQPFNFYLEAGP